MGNPNLVLDFQNSLDWREGITKKIKMGLFCLFVCAGSKEHFRGQKKHFFMKSWKYRVLHESNVGWDEYSSCGVTGDFRAEVGEYRLFRVRVPTPWFVSFADCFELFFHSLNWPWCLFFKCFWKFDVVLYDSVIDEEQNPHLAVHLFFSTSIDRFEKNSFSTEGKSLMLVILESGLSLGSDELLSINHTPEWIRREKIR